VIEQRRTHAGPLRALAGEHEHHAPVGTGLAGHDVRGGLLVGQCAQPGRQLGGVLADDHRAVVEPGPAVQRAGDGRRVGVQFGQSVREVTQRAG
jgi:hypothetical protein